MAVGPLLSSDGAQVKMAGHCHWSIITKCYMECIG